MASGIEHDRANNWLSLATVAGVLIAPAEVILPVTMGTIVGGLWLSPDLDLYRSRPTNRWQMLKLVWHFYRLLPHRHWFTHTPVVGTIGRLGYLSAIGLPVLWLLGLLPAVILWVLAAWPMYLAFAIGVELSALLHYWMDGIL